MPTTDAAESAATVKRPRGRPFQKGVPRPAGAGRRRGATNKATKDIREFIQGITLGDKTFCANLEAFCKSPQVFDKPHVLAVLFAYGFGKATPMAERGPQTPPLLFLTRHEIGTYDPLAAKAAALLERKKQAALPETKADSYVPPDPVTDPDALVVIDPEPGSISAQMIRPTGR